MNRKVLFIIEQGGYAVCADELARKGYEVHSATSMRKGLALLKSFRPDLIYAEFNYGPRYGVLISNLEPLLSWLQQHSPETRVIVFTEAEHARHLSRLQQQSLIGGVLYYPVDKQSMLEAASDALV